MVNLDKSIFDPLPDRKEIAFKKSLPQLSKIVDTAYGRGYRQAIFTKEEEKLFRILTNYIAHNKIPQCQTPEQMLVSCILPGLSIFPFLFNNQMFYTICGLDQETGAPVQYLILSEDKIQNFFKTCFFNTFLVPPNEIELTAILAWHHNKIDNVAAFYSERPPAYSYQVQALRALPYAFILHYKQEQNRTISPILHPYIRIDFSNPNKKLKTWLKAPNHFLPTGFNLCNYIAPLLSNLNMVFNGGLHKNREFNRCTKEHHYTFRILWSLSSGNLFALSALHDMFATVYLGQDFVQKTTNMQENVSIILCRNPCSMARFIKSVLNSSFLFSNTAIYLEEGNYLKGKTSVYTEYPISELCKPEKVSRLLDDEVTGHLANISIQSDKDDLDQLKKFTLQKELKHKNDVIFKGITHQPCKHYIHITDIPPVDPTPNIRIIELLGDISGKDIPSEYDLGKDEYKVQNRDADLNAAVIVILSLFNFFTPTALPDYNDIPTSNHLFASDEEIVRKFIEELFDDTTSKFTSEELKKECEKWCDKNKDTENFDLDISKSKNDDDRKQLAKNIGILSLPYTITEDIEKAFSLWRKYTAFFVEDIKLIDTMKKLYPLFYHKYHKAKSRIDIGSAERNVRVFYGLALNTKKLRTLSSKDLPLELDEQRRQEEFSQYYTEMIQNFQKLQPKIHELLEPPSLEKILTDDGDVTPTE